MFERILVATDGSDHANKAVDVAADLAVKYDGRLTILHILGHQELSDDLLHAARMEHLVEPSRQPPLAAANVPGNLAAVWRDAEQKITAANKIYPLLGENILTHAKERAIDRGVSRNSVETAMKNGEPAEQILKHAEQEDNDTIILGSRGLGNIKGLLMGSVSHKVSHLAKQTCITVK